MRASVTEQQVEPLAATPASHISSLVAVPAALFPTQLFAQVPEKTEEDSPGTWAPATHVEELDAAAGSWIWPGLAGLLSAIWEVKQCIV